MKSLEDWPLKAPGCRDCKQAMDNLAYASKVQREEEWWRETRKDPKALQDAVRKYHESCPVDKETKKRLGKFNIVKYLEEFRSVSRVVQARPGLMMHKEMFLGWAQTWRNPRGQCKDTTAAETQWEEYQKAAESGELIHDRSGPSGGQRIRIPTADAVDFQDSFEHSKSQLIQRGKDAKNLAKDAIAAGRRGLMRDHEKSLGRDNDDFGSVAKAMVTNAAAGADAALSGSHQSAFAGPGVFLPDLSQMQEELESARQEKLDAKKTKRGGGGSGGGGSKAKGGDSSDAEDGESEPQEGSSSGGANEKNIQNPPKKQRQGWAGEGLGCGLGGNFLNSWLPRVQHGHVCVHQCVRICTFRHLRAVSSIVFLSEAAALVNALTMTAGHFMF